MAEKTDQNPGDSVTTPREEKSSGNWWDSWITSAKSKSVEVYSMVKKDLDEIGTAVKCEASHVFNSTSTVIGKTLKLDVPESPANAMKKSFSTFIGQVSTVLNPEPDDEDDTEVILSSGDTTMLSTYKKELESLQRVDATYMVPADSSQFEAWRSSLEGEVISPHAAIKRLQNSPLLRAQYEKLVPDAVSHDDFWERYLFRVALLQDRLAATARKQPVEIQDDPVLAHIPAPEPVQTSPKKVLSGIVVPEVPDVPELDGVVAWEDEDFANDVELTEEQQTLLLEEYEREITSKKQKAPKDITNNNAQTTPKKNIDNKKDAVDNKKTAIDKKKSAPVNKKAATDNKKEVADNKKGTDNKKPIADSKKGVTDNKKVAIDKNKNKSPRKVKSDECGNLVEDYFGDKEVKDDASANSDESWEKEFEIDESVAQKA